MHVIANLELSHKMTLEGARLGSSDSEDGTQLVTHVASDDSPDGAPNADGG